MKVKKLILKEFKRFDDLTIDLGSNPRKIIALVGPNGCGKSSIFDAFEEIAKGVRGASRNEDSGFFSKALYYEEPTRKKTSYNKQDAIKIFTDLATIPRIGFYIRTAYRFTPKFNVTQIKSLPDIFTLDGVPMSSIALDTRLELNYSRLIGITYEEFANGKRTGAEVKKELLDKINDVLTKILDISISGLGNVIENRGQFFFKKGTIIDFPYSNLSSGEKEVVDIIIDLIVKRDDYNDTVFCIDEPELHLNTAIQRALLIEIEKLIPENCQLWVATHSIGFLRALQEDLKDKSQVLDFSEKNYFEGTQTIVPIKTTRKNWLRIFSTALEDLTGLISPKCIIYCEGMDRPGRFGEEKGFDAKVFNNIFSEDRNDALFISSGGNTELDQRSEIAIAILSKALSDIEVLVLKDRDISSGKLTTVKDRELYLKTNPSNHRVLKRMEIENYLFDKEVLKKYCTLNGKIFEEAEYDKFVTDIENQNIKDETGRIKNYCNITTSINVEKFKLNLSEIITSDMAIYKELESCVF